MRHSGVSSAPYCTDWGLGRRIEGRRVRKLEVIEIAAFSGLMRAIEISIWGWITLVGITGPCEAIRTVLGSIPEGD